MDLSIGEFQEVGNVIKQFASDDATVVVGTVIDPDMANQIRVTVVATGLGKPVAAARPASQQLQANAAAIAPPLTMRMVRPKSPMAPTDYAMLDKPTVQRQRAVGDGLRADVESEDLLDIPAFLRRQAD
jgi:cell division protein FtsZ